MAHRFLINTGNAKIMGVAAGIGDCLGLDLTFVRLALIALTLLTGPLTIVVYILTGLLAPRQQVGAVLPCSPETRMGE